MGKLYLIVELDAKTIVDIFGRNEHVNDMLSPILDECKKSSPSFTRYNLSTVTGKQTDVQTLSQG